MNRTISTSTEVFAAIWAQRKEGEETEDDILRRILRCPPSKPPDDKGSNASAGGLYDSRNDVHIPEGFEIFRVYRGTEFRAVVRNGKWMNQNNGKSFPTLNQLNQSLPVGSENAWRVWKYKTPTGQVRLITTLRKTK